jgi:hypothetical protein
MTSAEQRHIQSAATRPRDDRTVDPSHSEFLMSSVGTEAEHCSGPLGTRSDSSASAFVFLAERQQLVR